MSNTSAPKKAINRLQDAVCEGNIPSTETFSTMIGSDICRLENAVSKTDEIRAILVGDRCAMPNYESSKNEGNIYEGLCLERELICLLLDNLEAIKNIL